jgi:hypothetical protein
MNTLLDDSTKIPADKNYFKNKKYFSVSLLDKIDTAVIYKEDYYYSSNKKDFTPIDNKKWYSTNNRVSIYKFYSNGCINLFFFRNGYEIEKNDLNPEYKGHRGVYYIDNKGNIKIDKFVIVGYGFGPLYDINKSIVKIKGDTLLIKYFSNLTSVDVYVKQKIPKEWLIYKADW